MKIGLCTNKAKAGFVRLAEMRVNMDIQTIKNKANEGVQALQNLKVLDLTRVVAGPYGASVLGDFGADILKIEMPGNGDDARGYGPYANGERIYYANLNRNK